MKKIFLLISVIFNFQSVWANSEFSRLSWKFEDRKMDLFLPRNSLGPIPLVVYGHGQAMGVEAYDLTFEFLAKQGVAVLHPEYDKNFFDRNWNRMAQDFNRLTAETLKRYPQLNSEMIIYAGHSKGAYVALVAAGHRSHFELLKTPAKALLLFSPAGYDAELIKNLDRRLAVSLFYPEEDQIIKRELQDQIYSGLQTDFKQFILVKSYPNRKAEHFFPVNKKYIFGGSDGVSDFHRFGSWKWLKAAATDIINGNRLIESELYGDKALDSGNPQVRHKRL
ncbi:MAG: hypothetical protein ACK5V3_15955 [Bdellovibrionales bacterium]